MFKLLALGGAQQGTVCIPQYDGRGYSTDIIWGDDGSEGLREACRRLPLRACSRGPHFIGTYLPQQQPAQTAARVVYRADTTKDCRSGAVGCGKMHADFSPE